MSNTTSSATTQPLAGTGTVNVVVVAPATLKKVAPLSVLNCHCTVGVGLPLAAAVNTAVPPALTVTLTGFVVTAGPVCAWAETPNKRIESAMINGWYRGVVLQAVVIIQILICDRLISGGKAAAGPRARPQMLVILCEFDCN